MENSNIRKPAVAGQFYPLSAGEIKKQIEGFIKIKPGRIDCLACMLPHAGYIYSGMVAAETACGINIKDKIILLGPNHTGYGANFSIMSSGAWQTPLGKINIASGLAESLKKDSNLLTEDSLAHLFEHSLEVELPILQYFKNDFEIVPITILCDELNPLKELGKSIANVILKSDLKDSVMILASSDMTHYEPEADAVKKDKAAIQSIIELNEEGLMKNIRALNITMCGYAPVIAMITASKLLGAKTAKLIKYQTSADVTGDKKSVVGYAGIVVY